MVQGATQPALDHSRRTNHLADRTCELLTILWSDASTKIPSVNKNDSSDIRCPDVCISHGGLMLKGLPRKQIDLEAPEGVGFDGIGFLIASVEAKASEVETSRC
jgi:hypothetical protein